MYNRFSGIKLWSSKKIRSSRPEVFCKKAVLKSFTKFTEKHLFEILFVNKVAGLRPETSRPETSNFSCFPVNSAKLFKSTSGGCFWKILKIRCQNIYILMKKVILLRKTHVEWSLSFRHRKKLNIFTRLSCWFIGADARSSHWRCSAKISVS